MTLLNIAMLQLIDERIEYLHNPFRIDRFAGSDLNAEFFRSQRCGLSIVSIHSFQHISSRIELRHNEIEFEFHIWKECKHTKNEANWQSRYCKGGKWNESTIIMYTGNENSRGESRKIKRVYIEWNSPIQHKSELNKTWINWWLYMKNERNKETGNDKRSK